MSERYIAPGATLGVMGGGQLGRMFVHAAQQLGYFTAVLDADPASPAGLVSHHHVPADYLDAAGLAELARVSAAITTEFENVPAGALGTPLAAKWVFSATRSWQTATARPEGATGREAASVPSAPAGTFSNSVVMAALSRASSAKPAASR